MLIFTIEQSDRTYFADFVVYAVGATALAVFLGVYTPQALRVGLTMWAIAGLGYWTLIEYGVHRFVLHHIPPFRAMHEMHHSNPRALIGTPTIVTVALFALLVFMPAFMAANIWVASALTLGVLLGYIAYSVMHHAAHHWRSSNDWLKWRKQLHGLHHHSGQTRHYGVTTSVWDHVFRSTRSIPGG
jgi:sterol desaturase/sphingolipid hydroxylase (fatty acid hydroxylase superfamily)